jgi:pyruvate/2-oxoglutarate/acetoin dehydrogenase E1 component
MSADINCIAALNMALHDALETDESVVVFGEDIADPEGGGVIGVTRGLSSAFGDARVRSTPISEQAIIGAGIGAAIAGLRPVTEIMLMNFTTVAMDMIINHAAKLRFMSGGQTHVPMVIRTMTGAGMGNGGQHSDNLEAWFAHTAGLKVVTYSSPAEAYGLLLASIFDDDPVIFIENLPGYFVPGPPPVRGTVIPLGRANIMRSGSDVTLISYSAMANQALTAATALAKDGISAEVIDLRTVAPFDLETLLSSVDKTKRALIVHEATRSFGVGAEISAELSERLHGHLKAPVRRLGSAFCPVPFSNSLETAFVPNAATIEQTVRAML